MNIFLNSIHFRVQIASFLGLSDQEKNLEDRFLPEKRVCHHIRPRRKSVTKKREADSITAAGLSRVGFRTRTTRLPDESRP